LGAMSAASLNFEHDEGQTSRTRLKGPSCPITIYPPRPTTSTENSPNECCIEDDMQLLRNGSAVHLRTPMIVVLSNRGIGFQPVGFNRGVGYRPMGFKRGIGFQPVIFRRGIGFQPVGFGITCVW